MANCSRENLPCMMRPIASFLIVTAGPGFAMCPWHVTNVPCFSHKKRLWVKQKLSTGSSKLFLTFGDNLIHLLFLQNAPDFVEVWLISFILLTKKSEYKVPLMTCITLCVLLLT